jgi:hypothetical protein
MKMFRYFPYAIAAAIICVPFFKVSGVLTMQGVTMEKIWMQIMALFVVSLFLERAVDVFLTVTRNEKSEHLRHSIRQVKSAHKEKMGDNTAISRETIDPLENELHAHRSQTRSIALWTSFIVGLLVALVGVRTLQPIFCPDGKFPLLGNQIKWFQAMDIFITGGLLAGGSEGFHEIIKLYRSFMEKANRSNAIKS